MNIIEELEEMRKRVISNINTEFDLLIKRAKSEEILIPDKNESKIYECTYPLTVGTAVFKGKKPISVIFEDGRKFQVLTWKQLMKTVLEDCVADAEKKSALEALCGKITGKTRELISKNNENMKSPIEIAKGLYVETHYDTETLLNILMKRLLDVVSYDYNGISVVIRND